MSCFEEQAQRGMILFTKCVTHLGRSQMKFSHFIVHELCPHLVSLDPSNQPEWVPRHHPIAVLWYLSHIDGNQS